MQYASRDYIGLLSERGIQISISRKGAGYRTIDGAYIRAWEQRLNFYAKELQHHNTNYANQPTPAGQVFVNNSPFSVSQLQALREVAPSISRPPAGDIGIGRLRTIDMGPPWIQGSRSGVGTGVFALAAPRAIEFGMRISFQRTVTRTRRERHKTRRAPSSNEPAALAISILSCVLVLTGTVGLVIMLANSGRKLPLVGRAGHQFGPRFRHRRGSVSVSWK